jgi:hypothetical protein
MKRKKEGKNRGEEEKFTCDKAAKTEVQVLISAVVPILCHPCQDRRDQSWASGARARGEAEEGKCFVTPFRSSSDVTFSPFLCRSKDIKTVSDKSATMREHFHVSRKGERARHGDRESYRGGRDLKMVAD